MWEIETRVEEWEMCRRVCELRGVTEEIAAGLHALDIHTTTQLLAATRTPATRAILADALGVDANLVLELANQADLARIRGLTTSDAQLLALAGVDSARELRRRIPENLFAKLLMVAPQHDLPHSPRLDTVQQWVSEARALERAIFY